MKKPGWSQRPFRTVETIALLSMMALALTYTWPILERRMNRGAEIQSLVRVNPPAAAYGSKAADYPEYGEVGRGFLTSPEGLNAIWSHANPGTSPGHRGISLLGHWIDERLLIEPIKGTFLIRYSCVVEDPARDIPYLKATVDSLVEHFNRKQPSEGQASIADPIQPPMIPPISYKLRALYAAGFVLFVLIFCVAIIKAAQIRDSRPRFAV